MDPFATALTDEAVLRATYAPPSAVAVDKQRASLDQHCRAYLAACPFVVVSTAASDGTCDATPRGGPPGFVTVLDDDTLVVPDSTGNRRLDTFANVLSNGHAGLLCVVPGRSTTLRVNGRACVSDDPELLGRLTAVGRPPQLALVVRADEVFLHCPKAFVRSGLWRPQTWPAEDAQPSAAVMIRDHAALTEFSVAQVDRALTVSERDPLA